MPEACTTPRLESGGSTSSAGVSEWFAVEFVVSCDGGAGFDPPPQPVSIVVASIQHPGRQIFIIIAPSVGRFRDSIREEVSDSKTWRVDGVLAQSISERQDEEFCEPQAFSTRMAEGQFWEFI